MTENEISIARDKMQAYVGFALHPSCSKKKEFYTGAAAAINDLLCTLGHGAKVLDLMQMLNDAEAEKGD